MFWSFILALVFGFLHRGHIHIDPSTARNWYTSFYFSVVTFTTLGFGGVRPIDSLGQLWITEDYLHIYAYGMWNDEPGTWTQSCYVVEYSQLSSPTITGTTPSPRGQGAIGQDIVITGTGFPYGVTASFSGNDITVNSTTLVSSTELIANIDIASEASVEVRDITITSPYTQTTTGESIFSVNAAPTLLSIDPSSLLQGSENWDVSIMGSGFVDNLSASSGMTGGTIELHYKIQHSSDCRV